MKKSDLNFDYKYGFSKPQNYIFKAKKGLNEEGVRQISAMKKEPLWMTEFRLAAYKIFLQKKMPEWGADLSKIDFNDIYYYIKPTNEHVSSWEDLPKEIKDTYDKIGVPEAEKKFLAGVSAQYESEVVYESMNKLLTKLGVIFCDMDTALKKHPDIVKKYFATVIPPHDNKFAALNSSVWSGGSFVFIPKGVKVDLPLQAYFRINAERFGQFERTLIIAEEGSYVHYVEGCTAPIYTTSSLHAAVVEIIVKKNARVRYTTVQNWSKNVYNLVTKRTHVEENGIMEWVDCNIGSAVTMKYPSCYLMGKGARGEVLSIAYASKDQHQDAGAKMFHFAPNTTSRIISKSISKNGGRTSYRGLVQVMPGAVNSSVYVSCDALLIDDKSRSDTYPSMRIKEHEVDVQHEATVEKLGEEKLFYLSSRGINRVDAEGLLVNGFIEPVTREIPLEYTVELSRLINLEMSGSVG
ncbi:MAG: Fe-S cluster assembly protein SufB [bacterium]|nr:Fe-S cluster assembly protein SufB [bacterium]